MGERRMIERLVLFGATGDLAGRYLLPALAALLAAGRLPERFEVIGGSREKLDEEAFRRTAGERLEQHAAEMPAAAREGVVRSLRYRPVDVTHSASVASFVEPCRGPVAAYLALPPALFPAAVTALASVNLAAGSRVALEKPFGEDLASAIALNRLLAEALGPAGEQAVFRVDHVLGMASVQNFLMTRPASSVLEAVWDSDHIDQVEILWEETLALEGRAGYYDGAGALKDVVQNHVLQVLSLVAMEPPANLDNGQRLRERKIEALRSIRPPTREEAALRTRRARYGAGRLTSGKAIPAYADEEGVDPSCATETYVEIVVDVESPCWAGTRFVLRAGKALAERRKGVLLRFRPSVRSNADPNRLWIGVDGPDEISLHLTGRGGSPLGPVPLAPGGALLASDLPAYARILADLLEGGSTFSVGGDEVEEAWRVVTPVLDAWADGAVPLLEYPAGSTGPEPL